MPAQNLPSGCLGKLLSLVGIKPAQAPPKETKLPYLKREYFLSKAERSFYGVLQNTVSSSTYVIFAKVRVADLLYLPKGTEARQSYFNKIQAKHIDFILCDPQMVKPVLAIELDDATHKQAARQARDIFLDDAFKAAGFPLLRVEAMRSYNTDSLKQAIEQAVKA